MPKTTEIRPFRGPDGTEWGVKALLPSHSSAMLMFHHPDGRSARRDRYAWINVHGPEVNNVTAPVTLKPTLDGLTDGDVARLFRRSMPVESRRSMQSPAMARRG